MNINYHYLIMSQQDLLQNQVIEELLRERSNYYVSQNKNPDFWILTSPEYIENVNVKNKLLNSSFYKKHSNEISLISSSLKKDFFACLVSTNEDFIDWFKLRIGDFENLNENINKQNYKLDGIQLIIDSNSTNKNLLKFNKNKIHPELITNKFSQFINNSSMV